MTDEYQYGDQGDAREHAMRELQQLRIGYTSGVLTESELRDAEARVRERYGVRGWPTHE